MGCNQTMQPSGSRTMENRVKQYRTDSDGGGSIRLQMKQWPSHADGWNVETPTLHLDPDGAIGFGSLGIPSPDPRDEILKPAMGDISFKLG